MMKQRTLINLALFPVVLVLILVLALLTLDLNPYRDHILWSLEKSFTRKVQFSSIELTFHNGLALELHELSVGSEQDVSHFHTEKGVFRVEIIPLLRGELSFNQILLTKPVLLVNLPHDATDEEMEPSPSEPMLANLTGLKKLQLLDAQIAIEGIGRKGASLKLENIDLTLDGLQPGGTCIVDLKGELGTDGARTDLSLHSRIQIPQASESWIDRKLNVTFNAKELKRDQWKNILPPTIMGLLPENPFNLYLSLFNDKSGKLSLTVSTQDAHAKQKCATPNLTLKLQDTTLHGVYGGNQTNYTIDLEGNGELESCGENIARFNLRQSLVSDPDKTLLHSHIASDIAVARALEWLSPTASKLQAEGRVPLELEINGTSEQASWTLTSTLDPLALHWGKTMIKTPGIKGNLTARGGLGNRHAVKSGRMELGLFGINFKSLQGSTTGLTFEIEPSDLNSLGEIVPALSQWDISGNLSGNLRLEKTGAGWQRNGTFDVSGLSLNHPYPLGPVRNSAVQLTLRNERLDFVLTPLGLGESRLQVRGFIADLRQPEFIIHAESPSMLARDLVFKRPGARLNDLEGTLRIDHKGIDFIDAKVDLDSGTSAKVDGRYDFPTNRLYLEATASYGQIDEVIRLFTGPERWNNPETSQRKSSRPPFRVEIKASSEEGDISGVRFENAHGTVKVGNGQVEVYPLTFSGQGQGAASARVYYESRPGTGGWLRVSGSLREFDASDLHQQYWKYRGDIEGPLDSDFFLQGPSDKTFFLRGRGAVHFEIHDGSLRKFTGISKAFSILNISQIFTGSLPDVSGHGMKFSLARGTLAFGGGKIYSDDLVIFSNSMNMSMIGQANLEEKTSDYILGVQPLQTVDKVVSNIPLVGWILTGKDKALLTAHFQVTGPFGDPEVMAIPASSLGEGILGIFQRTLQLPGQLIPE